jgi:hypothetical protein
MKNYSKAIRVVLVKFKIVFQKYANAAAGALRS